MRKLKKKLILCRTKISRSENHEVKMHDVSELWCYYSCHIHISKTQRAVIKWMKFAILREKIRICSGNKQIVFHMK